MSATVDRAPDAVAAGTPAPLRTDLELLLGRDRVLPRAIDLIRYASDASPYRRIPQVVVQPRDAKEVGRVLAYGRREGIPVTLRGGGTSLNGQSQSDGILVDVRRWFASVDVLEDGAAVRVLPGTVLGHVNRVLAPLRRRLGPDPASTDIATVGGVIANNSGGMRCGTTQDSYSTLRSLTFVLPSGTVVDTAQPDADARLAAAEPDLHAGLLALRDELRADGDLRDRIRRKFAIKNTMGYRLCAFLDADAPADILGRLLVGSEGTLAFVAEAVFDTVAVPPRTTIAWLHFPDVDAAAGFVPGLVGIGCSAVELMGAPALMVAANSIPGTPERWKTLPLESAALLIELGGDDAAALDAAQAAATEALDGAALLFEPEFVRDHVEVELAWRVREGLHGLVGRLRPAGTALIVEDVCVPPERVAESVEDVKALLGRHGFLPGVAGHASAGNLHFMLTPSFAVEEDRARYEAFMADLVDLIVDKYDGSLKAEHGTGVNMAPFLEREWGAKATEMMWRIKALCDPDGVLAPGVLLNRDPDCHLRDLKTTPPIEEVATNCVECGFCEPVCPSRHLTTTPRQRIVIRREIARQAPGSPLRAALEEQFRYDGDQTCAADGTCALACPLGIDTGVLVKGLRAEEDGSRVAVRLAERWAAVERAARTGLAAADAVRRAVGDRPLQAGARVARRVAGAELVPTWPESMPRPAAPRMPATVREGATAVYLPACINRMFGHAPGAERSLSLPEALVAVSERAGKPVWIPDDAPGHCCGTPWTSKGHRDGARVMAQRTHDALWRWTDGGRLAVVIDASSCALGLGAESGLLLDEARAAQHAELQVLDSVVWAKDHLLPGLRVRRRLGSVAVHPTCATRKQGLTEALAALAGALADDVVVPITATCCGMAGDRGLLHPELTAAATAPMAAELSGQVFEARWCTNRTCEIGLQQATGGAYESIVFALEELTRRSDDPHMRHDPAHPTREELIETAHSEGLMATEEETDPDYVDDRDPKDVPQPDVG